MKNSITERYVVNRLWVQTKRLMFSGLFFY